jgi:hypothetical protein
MEFSPVKEDAGEARGVGKEPENPTATEEPKIG